LKICTEADYLQAHLTFIAGESGRRNPVFRNLKKWLRSVLKKWITLAKGPKLSKVDGIPKLLERVDALLPTLPNDGATLS
jgi:hypothetical protein